MYIGNDLIEAVQLDDRNIPNPGYVGQFKRNLKMKYRELIRQYANPPEFLVANPAPQNNSTKNKYWPASRRCRRFVRRLLGADHAIKLSHWLSESIEEMVAASLRLQWRAESQKASETVW